MVRDEEVTDSLFAFPVTVILGEDLAQLRDWYVCIVTKHIPRHILHTVQYSGEVVWSETGLWEHTGERDGEISTHCTLHVHNMYHRNAICLALVIPCRPYEVRQIHKPQPQNHIHIIIVIMINNSHDFPKP